MVKSVNEIRVLHPEFRIFEKSFHVRGPGTTPLTIDLVPIKYKFNLTILPKVNFRIFVDGWEHPRSINDKYEFPIFKTKRLTIKANGFEDTFLEVEESINNQNIRLSLIPRIETCGLLKAKTPFVAKKVDTNEEVEFLTSDRFIFGRGNSANIILCENIEEKNNHEDLFISREHFSIVRDKQKVLLKDHSSNGTYLNGKKIKESQELTTGINHQIEICNPNKQKAIIRNSVIVHADTNLGIPLFVSVRTFLSSSPTLAHILLFPECSLMRSSPEKHTEWLQKILPLISDSMDMDSTSSIQNEIKLWHITHKNQ